MNYFSQHQLLNKSSLPCWFVEPPLSYSKFPYLYGAALFCPIGLLNGFGAYCLWPCCPLLCQLPGGIPSKAARSLWLVDIVCDDKLVNLIPSRKSGIRKLEYGDGWQLGQKPNGCFKGSHDGEEVVWLPWTMRGSVGQKDEEANDQRGAKMLR